MNAAWNNDLVRRIAVLVTYDRPIADIRAALIAEGLTEWRWGDRVGYGWSEYLDHPA